MIPKLLTQLWASFPRLPKGTSLYIALTPVFEENLLVQEWRESTFPRLIRVHWKNPARQAIRLAGSMRKVAEGKLATP